MEKWKSGFETKKKGLFCDFWHIHDDFAIKNAKNIILKAGKAHSYSSLHDLSNGRNRQEIDTAKALSIVIIIIIQKNKISFWLAKLFKF
jgi:hypothetical protein